MTFALTTVAAGAAAAQNDPFTVMLAALNVLQTVALAYLAARSRKDGR